MKKYRKKPVVIEAFKLGVDPIPDWFMDRVSADTVRIHDLSDAEGFALVDTLEGTMTAKHGDFVIQGVKGELYPCKPDIFEATYDMFYDYDFGPDGPNHGQRVG